ncbi:1700022I11Rik [Phodopus roborovskii]|uniref:1700022I11Rik protein n=1 Tax=Phodopus roborovskii TaxID=109678 RepID=A0AAU9ZGY4_PHORO|nr:1700022I11Rik [Phodopus roborovskii]
MEWLLEDLLRAKGDIGLLQGQLTHVLACRHCSSSICLQSPGNLVILFLFMVWQIQRWWQIGKWQQLQLWCSGDMMIQGKSQRRKKNMGEEKEEESLSLSPLKPYSPSKDASTGNQFTADPHQPSCSSGGLPKATGIQEQVFTQPSSPSRSFPTFQILTNLPVRNKITSGSSLQQRKSQLFWGLPSLHSESLETIFLSSEGPSPLKLSICPSVFFNKVPFLPVYNLNLEGIVPGSQLVQSPPSPLIPLVPSNLKPLLIDCKGIISDTDTHTQCFTQQKEVPSPKIRPSTFLYSSEAWRETPGDPSLQQHNPDSPSASLLYTSNPHEVLTRSEVLQTTMKQHKHPKASESAMPTASPHPASLTEYQKANLMRELSGLKALWETTVQNENPQIYALPISNPCQFTVPMTEPQETDPPGTPPGYEIQWRIIQHKDNPQAFDPPMPASCQPPGSLSEVRNVNPKGGLSALKDFWGNMGHKEKPPISKSPVSAPCPLLDTLSEHQRENPLKDLSGHEPFETPTLDFNMWFYETIPACVPLGSETPLKGKPSTENLRVYADLVSAPSLPSVCLPDFAMLGPQRTKGQRKKLWVCDSPCPDHVPPIAPFLEPHRINTVDDFPRSEATWKDTEHTRKCLSSESPFLNLNPSPALVQPPLRVSPMENPFTSKVWCENIQRKNNFLASERPVQNLSQHLFGASSSGVLSNPAGGYMKQNENCCVFVSSVWESSSPPNSISKSHISEPNGNPCNCKPMESASEQRKDSWATKLPASSFLSAPSQEPHPDIEFICRNVQKTEASQTPGPLVMNPLQLPSWPPILAKALKSEPNQCGLQKEEMLSEAKAKAPSSQGGTVSGVCDHPVSHAWQWSRELKIRLKKLKQSPTFKSPGPQHSLCSPPALNSPTAESWGLSCFPHQTHLLSMHSCSPSGDPSKVQRTEPQFQSRTKVSKNKGIKGKVVVQTLSPGNVHAKANENCLGMGKPSNTGALVSSKRRRDKTLALPSAQKKGSPRKSKAEKCEGRTKRLGSSTATGKNNPAQASRPTEIPIHRFPKKSQDRAQRYPHAVLAQQFLSNAVGPQDQQRAGWVAGDTQKPHYCKHCAWAPKEKQLPSSTLQRPPNRGFQRLLAKFLGVRRRLPTKPSQKSMIVLAPSISQPEPNQVWVQK